MDNTTGPFQEALEPHSFDRYFSGLLKRLAPETPPQVLLAAAAARKAVGDGHACIDLAALCAPRQIQADWLGEFDLPADLGQWQGLLARSPLVGGADDFTPLVLVDSRLYLRRYWRYERELAAMLLARGAGALPVFSEAEVRPHLEMIFSGAREQPTAEHLQAAATALRQGLTVINGGPGTGKTSVVARILALIQALSMSRGKKLRLLLLAPTGKAAAKLGQAISERLADLPVSAAVKEAIPRQASTIHRLLGRQGNGGGADGGRGPGHIHTDVIVIDEASMVDLSLLHRLLRALPEKSSLLLLGDGDQLASVEAGSIFRDICEAGLDPGATAGENERPLKGSVIHLTRSFRFSPEHGIGQLAELVKKGEADRAVELLSAARFADLHFIEDRDSAQQGALEHAVSTGYAPVLQAGEPLAALRGLERFRVLCAHRRGPRGARKMNELAEHLLHKAGLINPTAGSMWYKGRPLIITSNCYSLGLFNGDTGVLWPDTERGGELRAFFYGADTGLRSIAPSRLPAHDTAFAMTIHKSQGSEFDEVVVVLPAEMSPVLSRELFYTALTRARARVIVCGARDIVRQTVAGKVERASGLVELLRRPDESSVL